MPETMPDLITELKPVKRKPNFFAWLNMIAIGATMGLVVIVVILAMLGPAMGNIFSNVVSNL